MSACLIHFSIELLAQHLKNKGLMLKPLMCVVLIASTQFSKMAYTSEVEVLPHPYPYEAALSISSDQHWAEEKEVDAVHALVMSDDSIALDSEYGEALFGVDNTRMQELYGDKISGFGFEMSDSFWMIDKSMGVFERSEDEHNSSLIFKESVAKRLDAGLREGRFDTLHTYGIGKIDREQARRATQWLKAEPYRAPKVWVSHAFAETPSGCEPDLVATVMIVKNLAKASLVQLRSMLFPFRDQLESVGLSAAMTRLDSIPKPYAYPENQNWLVFLIIGGTVFLFLVSLLLLFKKIRRKKNVLVLWACLCSVWGWYVWQSSFQYSLGDDSESEMYNIDLVQGMGIQFYWFIIDRPNENYSAFEENAAVISKSSLGGKQSIFRLVTLDDSSKVLAFSRIYSGQGGMGSLERLLTVEKLSELIEKEGHSIIYTHWTDDLPVGVFTPKSLEGLQRLKNAQLENKIWVTPTSKQLQYHYVSTFLNYETSFDDESIAIDIKGVDDPIHGLRVLERDDLRGLSFALADGKPVRIFLNGQRIETDHHQSPGRHVWQVPL